MSSAKSAALLNIPLKPSRMVSGFIYGAYLFAMLVIIMVDLSLQLTTLLGFIITSSVVIELQRQGIITLVTFNRIFLFQPITHLRWDSDDLWEVTVGRKTYAASLLPTSVRYSTLVILNFSLDVVGFWGKRRSAILTRENISEQDFRHLRVRLGVTSS